MCSQKKKKISTNIKHYIFFNSDLLWRDSISNSPLMGSHWIIVKINTIFTTSLTFMALTWQSYKLIDNNIAMNDFISLNDCVQTYNTDIENSMSMFSLNKVESDVKKVWDRWSRNSTYRKSTERIGSSEGYTKIYFVYRDSRYFIVLQYN